MSPTKKKLIWVRADHLSTYDERKKVVSTALEAGYVDIVIREEDRDLRRLGRFDAIVLKDSELFLDEDKLGVLVEIRSKEDMYRAYELKGKVPNVLVSTHDWKVIPLENLIAEFQGSGTRLIASASDPDEARLFLETLEVGVDGLALEPGSASELKDFDVIVNEPLPKLELQPAKILRISPVSTGDRACLDTCSIMKVGEGMLIGSQSACLFLVCSESQESEYVAARPFRVNAGPVHAYVLTPSGKTRYLSEIRGGDEVMAVDAQGNCRALVVGRSKIERRPLLLIAVKAGERKFSIILQNAETIRLCTPSGPVSVSDLKEGDEVLVRVESGGRHFGQAIDETITEI